MKYLLDTNTVSELMKKNKYTWSMLLDKKPNDIFLCEVVVAEIYYRLRLLGNTRKERLLQQELKPILEVIHTTIWDREVSDIFGQIKSDLSKKGTILSDLDIAIAAHAIKYGCILVTDNISDFKKVTGLNIVNWKKML